MSSSSKYLINNDDAEAPLLDGQEAEKKKTFMDKFRDIIGTTVFQTILSVVITVVIIIGMVGLVIDTSLREGVVSCCSYEPECSASFVCKVPA